MILTPAGACPAERTFGYPWRMDFERFSLDAINKLPGLLDEIEKNSPDGKNIDTLTLLHRVSGILDRICPFEKLR